MRRAWGTWIARVSIVGGISAEGVKQSVFFCRAWVKGLNRRHCRSKSWSSGEGGCRNSCEKTRKSQQQKKKKKKDLFATMLSELSTTARVVFVVHVCLCSSVTA